MKNLGIIFRIKQNNENTLEAFLEIKQNLKKPWKHSCSGQNHDVSRPVVQLQSEEECGETHL